MASPARTTARSGRRPLTRDRVLDAAITLADRDGIDRLSMRRLAAELGVEAMSLYHHITGKREILAAMIDAVVGDFEVAGESPEWKASLRRSGISAHDVLIRHPWAADLMLSGGVGPNRRRYMNELLGCLRRAGFSAEMTHHAYHALDSHILGFTLWQVGIVTGARDVPDLATTVLREVREHDLPYLAEHIEQHIEPAAPKGATEFEFGLDLILDGLERILVE
jgi:AcrR family transcriptional regulator